jgi:hypothetical protein
MDHTYIKVKSFNFNKAFRVEFERNYKEVKFYTRGFLAFGREVLYAHFYHTQINYYALLKAIPKNKLEEKDSLYISCFFSELSDCGICGYRAVFLDECHYCKNTQWDSTNKARWPNTFYETEHDYIKESQMDWILDADGSRKLRAAEKFFKQSTNHEILFTQAELLQYTKEQEEL